MTFLAEEGTLGVDWQSATTMRIIPRSSKYTPRYHRNLGDTEDHGARRTVLSNKVFLNYLGFSVFFLPR